MAAGTHAQESEIQGGQAAPCPALLGAGPRKSVWHHYSGTPVAHPKLNPIYMVWDTIKTALRRANIDV